MCLVMELVDKTLGNVLHNGHRNGMPQGMIKVYLWQLLQVTAFLHQAKVDAVQTPTFTRQWLRTCTLMISTADMPTAFF
jgi:hypothetical protein